MSETKKPKKAAKQDQAPQKRWSKISDSSSSEPAYVKLYVKNLPYLSSLSKVDYPVLWALLSNNTPSVMQMTISISLKRKISEELACRMSRINNAVAYLVKTELLIKEDSGLYSINPHIFGED